MPTAESQTLSTKEAKERKYEKLYILRHKLDKEIGYNYWKKYVASAFWSQISTPINLTITFLTAITTAQSQSDGLLAHELYSQIAIISLVITTLNTFFRPHTQYAANTEYLAKWKELGIKFEKEYFNRMEDDSEETYNGKIKAYSDLQEEVDMLRKSEGTEMMNFLTDFIYFICYRTCLRRYKRWLDVDRRIVIECKREIAKGKAVNQGVQTSEPHIESEVHLEVGETTHKETETSS